MATPSIILNNLSFHLEYTSVQFEQINMAFHQEKYGIVGANGIGKTTFLKLLSGELAPNAGTVLRQANIMTMPQSYAYLAPLGEVLGVTTILDALQRIHNGSVAEADFAIADQQWDLEQRISTALSTFHLWPINLQTPFAHLSGGQKTKALLARTLIFPSDFVIFDEPTNNLDRETRAVLYDYISGSKAGLIIVSHDRTLLNKLDVIIELNSHGFTSYRGNYDFYATQKAIKQQAIQNEIQARTEALQKAKQLIQTRMERHQQNEAKGHRTKYGQIKARGSYDKLALKSQKGRSEKTNRRIRIQAERKLEDVNQQLVDAKAQLEITENIDASLQATQVATQKVVLKIEALGFSYDPQQPLINNLQLQITGPERVALLGPNGCGKSTLIKLIRGELTPQRGQIYVGVEHIAYLDQNVSMLDYRLSLVDNYLRMHPRAKPFDAYAALAAFKFRNNDAEKIVYTLSGGERMRAGLAMILMAQVAPQLIILDEPTNHLDLISISAIENMLAFYQGAILAVSHDEIFLENIKIERFVAL